MEFEEKAVLAAADYARGQFSRDIAEVMKSGFVAGATGKAKDDMTNYSVYDALVYKSAYNAGLRWNVIESDPCSDVTP